MTKRDEYRGFMAALQKFAKGRRGWAGRNVGELVAWAASEEYTLESHQEHLDNMDTDEYEQWVSRQFNGRTR